MPLVGGELAHAAFEHGMEEYAVDILRRYHNLLADNYNESYLWYHADGTPGRSSSGTHPFDGWGSSAMLYAFMEGLVGVVDTHKMLDKIRFSPRWIFTECSHVEANIAYPAGGVLFNYVYDHKSGTISIVISGAAKDIEFHIPVPSGHYPTEVTVNGENIDFADNKLENSHYADFHQNISSSISVCVTYQK